MQLEGAAFGIGGEGNCAGGDSNEHIGHSESGGAVGSVEAHARNTRSAHKIELVLEDKLVADGFFGLVCENDLRIGIDGLHDGGIEAIVSGYLLFGEHFGTAFAGYEGAVRGGKFGE